MLALDEFLVQIGSRTFEAGGPWPSYIEERLNDGIDNARSPVQRKAAEFVKNVTKYVEHFHGSRPWNGSVVNNSNRLQRRTGGTIEQFKRDVRFHTSGKEMDFEAKHDVGAFGIHLEGGVIRAKRSKYLTIPLPSACDRRGVPIRKSARDWPNTFVINSRKGNLLIVHKVNGKIVPLYLLKSSVRIPPRMHKFPEVWDGYVNRLEAAMIKEIERAIDNIRW